MGEEETEEVAYFGLVFKTLHWPLR